jgi:L-ascorbate metabolism protein UlaG (beta-lactamase superfamily)
MLKMKSATLSTLLISVLLVLIVGCTPATPAPVTLQYIGCSSTLITAPDGTRIVSDPYPDRRPTGLDPLPSDLEADVVTVSHSHFDHNYVEGVGGEPQIIRDTGSYQVGMVEIAGYESGEGSPSGPTEISNIVFVFEIGEVKIVHMGDAGILIPPDLLAAIENADVIIVNVDGYVLPFDQFMEQMQQINARTIIPSHYSISADARFYTWATVEEFLETLPSDVVVVREGSEIQVTPGMPEQVVVLAPLALVE